MVVGWDICASAQMDGGPLSITLELQRYSPGAISQRATPKGRFHDVSSSPSRIALTEKRCPSGMSNGDVPTTVPPTTRGVLGGMCFKAMAALSSRSSPCKFADGRTPLFLSGARAGADDDDVGWPSLSSYLQRVRHMGKA